VRSGDHKYRSEKEGKTKGRVKGSQFGTRRNEEVGGGGGKKEMESSRAEICFVEKRHSLSITKTTVWVPEEKQRK